MIDEYPRADAIAGEHLCGKSVILVVARDADELRLGAESSGVRRHDAGPADEALLLDRRDDDRGVLLRHSERIAVDVAIDDQVTDHEHADAGDAAKGAP